MGVAGLWDIIRSTGQTRSLVHLATVDGFQANGGKNRGFRIGIDASIWFFHAAYGKEGENPELRTLFFRCSKLMTMPLLPLFVFDGPKRPSVKRGKRIRGEEHWLTKGMRNIIEAFGFEWITAPGEAEAELAYLNNIGIIDGILSDDVDNFLFGANLVIRNPSNTLSGNRSNPVKNSAGKDDGQHVMIYDSKTIEETPDIGLTRGGFILIGLLSGGDYHQAGVARCGPQTAHGLARCGFGDALFKAANSLNEVALHEFLDDWRNELRAELRNNARGFLTRKSPSLADAIPDDFPNIEILFSYTRPVTSETERSGRQVHINWSREPDLGQLAAICELYFEWGVKPIIVKRFRTVLWPAMTLRILRRAVLQYDEDGSSRNDDTKRTNDRHNDHLFSAVIAKYFSGSGLKEKVSSNDDDASDIPFVVKIHSTRNHASTDGILEYRIEIAPAVLVNLTERGVKGIRPPLVEELHSTDDCDDGEESEGQTKRTKAKKPPPDPTSHLRVWMPACMVEVAEPDLVRAFQTRQTEKRISKEKTRRAKESKAAKARSLDASDGESLALRESSPVSSAPRPAIVDLKSVFPTKKRVTNAKAQARRGSTPSRPATAEIPRDDNVLNVKDTSSNPLPKKCNGHGDGNRETDALNHPGTRAGCVSSEEIEIVSSSSENLQPIPVSRKLKGRSTFYSNPSRTKDVNKSRNLKSSAVAGTSKVGNHVSHRDSSKQLNGGPRQAVSKPPDQSASVGAMKGKSRSLLPFSKDVVDISSDSDGSASKTARPLLVAKRKKQQRDAAFQDEQQTSSLGKTLDIIDLT